MGGIKEALTTGGRTQNVHIVAEVGQMTPAPPCAATRVYHLLNAVVWAKAVWLPGGKGFDTVFKLETPLQCYCGGPSEFFGSVGFIMIMTACCMRERSFCGRLPR